ncbi:MAG: diguanylate cyclase [Spirochaetia bacterium]
MVNKFEGTEDYIKLSFFSDIAKSISSAKSLRETINEVMRNVGEIFGPKNWSLLLYDSKEKALRFVVATGVGGEKLKGNVMHPGQGIAGWIFENEEPLIIEDVSKDHRFDAAMDNITGFTTKSIIGVPLKTDNRCFGVIELINKLDETLFTPVDLKILRTIADFAAIAIERAYYVQALKRMASTDELTGLQNQRGFLRAIEKEFNRCERTGNPLTMLLMDVDCFKEINDEYGHRSGDLVLKDFAGIINCCVRKIDIAARYGGDEFVVLLPEADLEAGEEVKSRIIQKVDESRCEVPYSVSIGVHSSRPENLEAFFDETDAKLYEAKENKPVRASLRMKESIFDYLEKEQ